MHNQATQQGRYLGGRPPYGYQLVDAGPHPNPADASSASPPTHEPRHMSRGCSGSVLPGTASPASRDTSTNEALAVVGLVRQPCQPRHSTWATAVAGL